MIDQNKLILSGKNKDAIVVDRDTFQSVKAFPIATNHSHSIRAGNRVIVYGYGGKAIFSINPLNLNEPV